MSCPIFVEEVKERSSIAHAARYKKGKGGRAIHTRLPSDRMTNAQIAKKNGPVESYQLGKAMSWEAFKNLPDDRLKKEYLNKLVNKHGGTSASIARMFGVQDVTVRRYAKTLGIQFTRGKTKEQCQAWERFLMQSDARNMLTDPKVESDHDSEQETVFVTDDQDIQEQAPVEEIVSAPTAGSPAQEPEKAPVNPAVQKVPCFGPGLPNASDYHYEAVPPTTPNRRITPPGYPSLHVQASSGTVTVQGPAKDCLASIAAFLGDTSCTIRIQWTTDT